MMQMCLHLHGIQMFTRAAAYKGILAEAPSPLHWPSHLEEMLHLPNPDNWVFQVTLLWMISLTFCFSAIVSASLDPESVWADSRSFIKIG